MTNLKVSYSKLALSLESTNFPLISEEMEN